MLSALAPFNVDFFLFADPLATLKGAIMQKCDLCQVSYDVAWRPCKCKSECFRDGRGWVETGAVEWCKLEMGGGMNGEGAAW